MTGSSRDWLFVDSPRRALAFWIGVSLAAIIALFLGSPAVWRAYAWLPDHAATSGRLQLTKQLATTWRYHSPDVLLLGGSQMRELFPADDFISTELSISCGRPIRVLNAASSSQTLATAWSFAEHFDRLPSVVIVAPALWRADRDSDAGGLGRAQFLLPDAISMPAEYDVVSEAPLARWQNRIGILASDALVALRSQWGDARSQDEFQSAQHGYSNPGLSSELKVIEARFQRDLVRRLDPRVFDKNLEAYFAFASYLRGRNGEVDFVLTPSAPEATQLESELDDQYSAAARRFAELGGVLDLRKSEELESADFYDAVHLLSSGRRKMWPQLEAFLISTLSNCDLR